ncbi:MAG: hypothetical protein AAB466_03300 [Verrucomicrobiota bacterium]
MMTKNLEKASFAAAAAGVATGLTNAAENKALDETIAKIKDKDDKVRSEAWQTAATCGAPAVKPLASLLADPEIEVTRAAKRALLKIVRQAGRPGAGQEKKAVVVELIPLLAKSTPTEARRELVWMLSELGGDESVGPVAALLSETEMREDARMVLQRIPGQKSIAALKSALASAPEDFKANLAVSLRQRGVKVEGYPSQKLVPTKSTNVKPAKVS